MSEVEPKPVDFSQAKEPPNSIDSEVDTTTDNPNLDPKLNLDKPQDSPEKDNDGIPLEERMIQQAWLRGGR